MDFENYETSLMDLHQHSPLSRLSGLQLQRFISRRKTACIYDNAIIARKIRKKQD